MDLTDGENLVGLFLDILARRDQLDKQKRVLTNVVANLDLLIWMKEVFFKYKKSELTVYFSNPLPLPKSEARAYFFKEK